MHIMKQISSIKVARWLSPTILNVTCTCLLVVFSTAPVMADQCQSIKDKMTQLQLQIDKESEHLYSPCCKPGQPSKPVKDLEV